MVYLFQLLVPLVDPGVLEGKFEHNGKLIVIYWLI